MKHGKRATIKRAERRAVDRWVERYQSTYAAVMADKDARLAELEAALQRAEGGCIACPSLAEVQMRAKEHEREAERVTAARDRLAREWSQDIERRTADCNAAHERTRQAIAARDDVESKLIAVGRERDQAREDAERLTAILAAEKGQLEMAGDELHDVRTELVAVAEERDRLQRQADEHALELRTWHGVAETLTSDRDRLQQENMALASSLAIWQAQAANGLVHTERCLKDARLGELVRAMPDDYRLDCEAGEYRVEVYRPARSCAAGRWYRMPEDALTAAGVTVPAPANETRYIDTPDARGFVGKTGERLARDETGAAGCGPADPLRPFRDILGWLVGQYAPGGSVPVGEVQARLTAAFAGGERKP